jgi:hypothetical protein
MNIEKIRKKHLSQLIDLNKLHEEKRKRVQNIAYVNKIKEAKKSNMYKHDYDTIRNFLDHQQVKVINPDLEQRIKYLEQFF